MHVLTELSGPALSPRRISPRWGASGISPSGISPPQVKAPNPKRAQRRRHHDQHHDQRLRYVLHRQVVTSTGRKSHPLAGVIMDLIWHARKVVLLHLTAEAVGHDPCAPLRRLYHHAYATWQWFSGRTCV